MTPTDPPTLTALVAPLIQIGRSMPETQWPYLDSLMRLSLALALGLLIGMERERRGKEAVRAPSASLPCWARWAVRSAISMHF